ncbi:MAG: hypothetical protein ABI629_16145 [bacterium]
MTRTKENQMLNKTALYGLAATLAVIVAGCGLKDNSGNSIFDNGSNAQCSDNGTRYSDGSALCRSGKQYRCKDGRWKDQGKNCGQSAGDSCEFNGHSYPSGKSRCQSGTRYRCDNGAWTSVGNNCKS